MSWFLRFESCGVGREESSTWGGGQLGSGVEVCWNMVDWGKGGYRFGAGL